jgi:hypothetical protein
MLACAGVANHQARYSSKVLWQHGKNASMPLPMKARRRRISPSNCSARITSAPMSFRSCAGGRAVRGAAWTRASASKQPSSAGAYVDAKRAQVHRPARRYGRVIEPGGRAGPGSPRSFFGPRRPPRKQARRHSRSYWGSSTRSGELQQVSAKPSDFPPRSCPCWRLPRIRQPAPH